MPTEQPAPIVRHSDDIEHESVDAAEGMAKGVLIGDEHAQATSPSAGSPSHPATPPKTPGRASG